jgi:hypothetical protein
MDEIDFLTDKEIIMRIDDIIEQNIVDAGLDAPRVTLAEIDAKMSNLAYERWIVPNTTTTVVVAIMPDGFVVGVGKSAAVSKDNFNADIGVKIATADCERNARDKLWELEGYALKQSLNG